MSTRFSLNSSNHSRRSAKGSSEFLLLYLFLRRFGVFGVDLHHLRGAISSLRFNAGLEDELEAGRMLSPAAISTSLLNESYDSDVEEKALPELADSPGTTRGAKLSVLQIMLFPSLVNRGF